MCPAPSVRRRFPLLSYRGHCGTSDSAYGTFSTGTDACASHILHRAVKILNCHRQDSSASRVGSIIAAASPSQGSHSLMQGVKVSGRPKAVRPGPPSRRFGPDSLFWLALVSFLFLVAEVTGGLRHMPLGADEIGYIARTSLRQSGVMLPPVHGQGAGLLAAPVTLLTTSLGALRVWMSLLSAIGLFLGML